MKTDHSDRSKDKYVAVIETLSYTLSSQEEVEQCTILSVDEINRRIAFIMREQKQGRSAGFSKPLTSKSYKQDAHTLYTKFEKATTSKVAAEEGAAYGDLIQEFNKKFVVPRPIKLEKQDKEVKTNFGWMKPFPQALSDLLASSITACESNENSDQKYDFKLPLLLPPTPKRSKIQRNKRRGPPIPQLGRPFKKRHIDCVKASDFKMTPSHKLLLQLVLDRKKKEKDDELNKLSVVQTDDVKIKVEWFEDSHLDDAVVPLTKME